MIIEKTMNHKVFANLKSGDVFCIGEGVHMVIESALGPNAVNLRTGKLLRVNGECSVTPFPDAKLEI